MSGYPYAQPSFNSAIYNPIWYANYSDATLSLALTNSLYVGLTDFRLSYITGIVMGTASVGKALVLDGNANITGINSLSCSSITINGSAFSPSTYLTVANAASTYLTIANASSTYLTTTSASSSFVPLTDSRLTYLNGITAGTALPSTALVLNSSSQITGISTLCLGSSTDTSRILSMLNGSQAVNTTMYNLTYGQSSSANNQVEFGFYYLASGSTSNALSIGFFQNTNILRVNADKSVDIPQHNGSTTGLKLNGTLITATASQINYLSGITQGTAVASKALVLDPSSNITGINTLTATSLVGTITTASQPNITSVGTLSSLTVSGSLSGTLSTAAQPNITSVGTLSSLTLSGTLTLGTTAFTSTQAGYLTGITAGTASNSKALVLSALGSISGIIGMYANILGGTLQTASQPYITSLGTLTSLAISNTSSSLLTITNTSTSSLANMLFYNDNRSFEMGLRGSSALYPNTFYIYDTANTAFRILISTSGNVGINNTSPNYSLDVGGSCNATSYYLNGSALSFTALSNATPGTAAASTCMITNSSNVLTMPAGSTTANMLQMGNQRLYYDTTSSSLWVDGNTAVGGLVINNSYFNYSSSMLKCIVNSSSYGTFSMNLDMVVNSTPGCRFYSPNQSLAINTNSNSGAATNTLFFTASGGAIGINTITPSSAFNVDLEGTLHANQISMGSMTTVNGSDFICAIDSTLTGSGQRSFRIGSALSNNNSFSITYNQSALGAASNSISFQTYGASNSLSINASGLVGIGTGTPNCAVQIATTTTFTLGVGGTTYYQSLTSNSTVSSGVGPVSYSSSLSCAGYVITTGLACNSDRRLKTDFSKISQSYVDHFFDIAEPLSYFYKSNMTVREYGFIAQHLVREGYHELLILQPHDDLPAEEEFDIENVAYSLNYQQVSIMNTQMIQSLRKKIQELEERLNKFL